MAKWTIRLVDTKPGGAAHGRPDVMRRGGFDGQRQPGVQHCGGGRRGDSILQAARERDFPIPSSMDVGCDGEECFMELFVGCTGARIIA